MAKVPLNIILQESSGGTWQEVVVVAPTVTQERLTGFAWSVIDREK